jgi:hypothetical protein
MSSHVSFVDTPYLFPHVCYRCRTGENKREFYVDTGLDTEFVGRVYLCDSCFGDMCDLSHNRFFTKHSVDLIVAEHAEQQYQAQKIIDRQDYFLKVLEEGGINTAFFLEKVEEFERGTRSSGHADNVFDSGQGTSPESESDASESDIPSDGYATGLSDNPLLTSIGNLRFD